MGSSRLVQNQPQQNIISSVTQPIIVTGRSQSPTFSQPVLPHKTSIDSKPINPFDILMNPVA